LLRNQAVRVRSPAAILRHVLTLWCRLAGPAAVKRAIGAPSGSLVPEPESLAEWIYT